MAAAGNEFQQGNLKERRPAADSHVLTVAAVNPRLRHACFSNA